MGTIGRVAVIGQGSIGRRHTEVSRELGLDVAVVSRRPLEGHAVFDNIGACLTTFRPDVVVIATETSAHADNMIALAKYKFEGRLLVEKPLFDRARADLVALAETFAMVAVAYPLRFHPLVIRLIQELTADPSPRVLVRAMCGQYLPDWRPGTDYRASYSAAVGQGGGVLRDLSHEIDLAVLLGASRPTSVSAQISRSGGLQIESDSIANILIDFANGACAVVSVDYLARSPVRSAHLTTEAHSYAVDFISGRLDRDGVLLMETSKPFDRNLMYREQMRAVFDPKDRPSHASWQEGYTLMRIIDASERAAKSGMRQVL